MALGCFQEGARGRRRAVAAPDEDLGDRVADAELALERQDLADAARRDLDSRLGPRRAGRGWV
jgi:hypothetical protein